MEGTGYTAPPPPTYNETAPAYNNPPGYNQPPNSGYTAPPPTNPNYAGPTYAAAPPTQNYTAPPTQNYTAPPTQNYNQPPTQPHYAGPPSGGPQQHAVTVTTTTVTRSGFTYGLCDCFGNMKWCCYVTWCPSCAVGDLRAAFDGQPATWWLTVILLAICQVLICVPHVWWLFWLFYNIMGCAFLMCVAQNMRQRLHIGGGDGCTDCILGYFCYSCYICQLGRELELTQNAEVRELVLNIQRGSPCNQSCMLDGPLPM